MNNLSEGHSIATKALNEAKEETENARLEDAEDLIHTANYFFETYFPDALRFDFTGEELVNAMEELAPELRKFSKMIEALSTPDKKEKPATLSSDPFSYFFKNFNL